MEFQFTNDNFKFWFLRVQAPFDHPFNPNLPFGDLLIPFSVSTICCYRLKLRYLANDLLSWSNQGVVLRISSGEWYVWEQYWLLLLADVGRGRAGEVGLVALKRPHWWNFDVKQMLAEPDKVCVGGCLQNSQILKTTHDHQNYVFVWTCKTSTIKA